jgi:hypothetical protein
MFSPCFCKISFAVDISQGGLDGMKVNRLTGKREKGEEFKLVDCGMRSAEYRRGEKSKE